jgi:hypothetical protein
MKSTKYCLKMEGRSREVLKEYHRGRELVQSTLHASIELSQ